MINSSNEAGRSRNANRPNGQLQYLLVAFLISLFSGAYAQQDTYYVVHVKGEIYNSGQNKALKVGDAVKDIDKVRFNPDKSTAVFMSTKTGRFTLGKPTNSTASSTGEFVAFLKNTLVPEKSTGNLSTRENTEVLINDLKNTLGEDAFIFPDDRAVFLLDPSVYPMGPSKFFIYRSIHDQKSGNLMIPFSGDSLFIEMDKLNGAPDTNTKAEIYYYDKDQNSSMKVTSFTPIFAKSADLEVELTFLVQLYRDQKLSRGEILKKLVEHVMDVYTGKTDLDMMERWLWAKKIL